MMGSSQIDDLPKAHTDGLSPSDQTYLEFRQTVGPGLIDAQFDLTPSKSEVFHGEISGERLTDQTLYRHVMNGVAFGARFNRALQELDPESALSQDRLLDAFRLFAVHDFHKMEPAQRRREAGRSWEDTDKDVEKERARKLIDTLGLDDFEESSELKFKDYWASILGAEKGSGRHRSTASRTFHSLKSWVRLMDGAAALDDPTAADRISSRVNNISTAVEIHTHRVDDVKGLATNLLNTSLAEQIGARSDTELVVFFRNGALYLTDESVPDGLDLFGTEEELAETLSDHFVETIRDSREELSDPRTLRQLLDDSAYRFGYYKITPLTYLFGDLEQALEAVRSDLVDRGLGSEPNEYSVYTDAMTWAVGTEMIDDVPTSHVKPQLLGVFIGTVYHQLFKSELNDGDSIRAIQDLAAAFGCHKVGEQIIRGHRDSDEEAPSATDSGLRTLADAFDQTTEETREDLDAVTIGGGKKVESQLLAIAYLNQKDEDGTPRSEYPLEAVLDQAREDVSSYYSEWQDHWDNHADDAWDPDQPAAEKREAFERTLRGNLRTALPWYVERYVSVDGESFAAGPSEKFDAYNRASQARICLTCTDQLVGESNSLDDFEVTGSVVGRSLTFTHFRTIDPANERGITSSICPLCELEFTLRNAIQPTNDADETSRYLFLAPDYFHSPVDIQLAKQFKRRLHDNGGAGFYTIATKLVGSTSGSRSEEVAAIHDELLRDQDSRNTLLNYDGTYDDRGALGVFRLDPQSRPGREGTINRTSQWILNLFAATAMAWFTGSRVILSDAPIPATEFDEVTSMVTTEGAPAPIQRQLPTSSTISFLFHLGREPDQYDFRRRAADDAEMAEDSGDSGRSLHVATDLGVSLYTMASLAYVTNRAHGIDFQRLTTVLDATRQPFPGASTVLKEADDAPLEDYSALFAATVLDTLTNPSMSNSIKKLAEAGFEVVQPETATAGENVSNHEYERLFRAAREALSDRLAHNASTEELVDIVSGVVMEAGSRTRKSNARTDRDRQYADERYTREPAEEFAEIFVKDVYEDICDGDFYELRRQENSLASGYNAAIRRRQIEWFEEVAGDGDAQAADQTNED